jgi:hypothetical protein
MVKLHNWYVTDMPWGILFPYAAPDAQKACIAGYVEDHPTFHNGHPICTDPIGSVCMDLGGEVFVSAPDGTTYQLMEVDHSYEMRYPNAVDTLLDSRAKEHV